MVEPTEKAATSEFDPDITNNTPPTVVSENMASMGFLAVLWNDIFKLEECTDSSILKF